VTEDDDDGESNFHADDKSLMTRRRNDSDAENQVARTKTTTTMSVTIDKDENDVKGNDDDVPPPMSVITQNRTGRKGRNLMNTTVKTTTVQCLNVRRRQDVAYIER